VVAAYVQILYQHVINAIRLKVQTVIGWAGMKLKLFIVQKKPPE
jgi:hypothetical protein